MKRWTPIEEIIAQWDRDPMHREALEEARRRLAPKLYPPGHPSYERMMRGEPPPERTNG